MARRVPRLILVCGLPGAGKTTLAKAIEAQSGALRLSPDEEMEARGLDLFDALGRVEVETAQGVRAQAALEAGSDVVLENGFWAREEREARRRWARGQGLGVELRFVDAPDTELERRLEARSRAEGWESSRITPTMLAEWRQLLEVPDAEEMALYDPPEAALGAEPIVIS